eukprot:1268577-Prymnesium_polylepis.2
MKSGSSASTHSTSHLGSAAARALRRGRAARGRRRRARCGAARRGGEGSWRQLAARRGAARGAAYAEQPRARRAYKRVQTRRVDRSVARETRRGVRGVARAARRR